MGAADGQQAGDAGGPAAQVAGPEGYVCLACGCRIAEGARVLEVLYRRRPRTRYRHEDSDGCADALRAPQPNKALIGRYEALPTFEWGPRPGGQQAQGGAG
jgi:hypothetical protein